MVIFKKISDLRHYLAECRNKKQSIGFVPTMGALHAGHLSLLEISRGSNQVTVCSIFVNPTQFNDPKDYDKYPITIEKDIYELESNGCDVLFLPPVSEIYPDGIAKRPHYDLGYLETILEGEYRPGHFQGVCMVVDRLLTVVEPDNLYLGQKDFQQCMVIKKLIELKGMKGIQTNICPIMREPDGLAMSSRNLRLDADARATATTIYKTLLYLKQNIGKASLFDLKKEAVRMLEEKGFKVDYVEIADPVTLHTINEWDARNNIIGLIAAFIGEVRLIDNMQLN